MHVFHVVLVTVILYCVKQVTWQSATHAHQLYNRLLPRLKKLLIWVVCSVKHVCFLCKWDGARALTVISETGVTCLKGKTVDGGWSEIIKCQCVCFAMVYLQFSLLRFVDHLRAVPQNVAVQNPKVLNVVFDDIVHLRFIFPNHHSKIPLRGTESNVFSWSTINLRAHMLNILCCRTGILTAAVKHFEILNSGTVVLCRWRYTVTIPL